ncbi:predicted protein [Botrytis cinerea T4]|uniref:Uncharacterized protein n=1 Tax=Botryotinia fuckeliana (strain T4) TaxID=999810 RepID=G2YK20_BOTF4|nr:predicted protein [Botrytis cinerea T4]
MSPFSSCSEIRHATKTRVHAGSSAIERYFGPDVSGSLLYLIKTEATNFTEISLTNQCKARACVDDSYLRRHFLRIQKFSVPTLVPTSKIR